jgi:hypothetical protein
MMGAAASEVTQRCGMKLRGGGVGQLSSYRTGARLVIPTSTKRIFSISAPVTDGRSRAPRVISGTDLITIAAKCARLS